MNQEPKQGKAESRPANISPPDNTPSIDPALADTYAYGADGVREPNSNAIGHRIGRYVVEKILGEGGFGTVYLALDEQLGRPVAIKVPRQRDSSDKAELDRIYEEARTAVELKHSSIVTVHDVGRTEEGIPFVVMEYIDGQPLEDLLRSERLSHPEAAQLMAEIASAVHHAHTRGFVHRDLKPSNILLDGTKHPYVVDFGLTLHEDTQASHAGEYAGTLPYMSPEQVRGESEHVDGRTDVWALGVILYEMLTGRRPFRADRRSELETKILSGTVKPPRQIDDSVPATLERICSRCLAVDVMQRYSTAADVKRDLRHWQRRRGKTARLLGITALIVAILAIALAVWHVGRKEGGQTVPMVDEPISGTIEVVVWSQDDPSRRRMSIRDPGALPLEPGDQIRIEAKLNRPGYPYLLWINARGEVLPVYPWTPGDWNSKPAEEERTDRLSLPAVKDEGWAVEPPFGTETFVFLARDEPLADDVDLPQLLGALPAQQLRDISRAVWFNAGHLESENEDKHRGFDLSQTSRIDDSLLRTQRLLQERLGPHFSLNRAVSFTSGE